MTKVEWGKMRHASLCGGGVYGHLEEIYRTLQEQGLSWWLYLLRWRPVVWDRNASQSVS